MEINIGISECDKNVDNYYSRNIGCHTAPAERLSTVSSPFMVFLLQIVMQLDIIYQISFLIEKYIKLCIHQPDQGRRKVWKSGGLVVLGGDNVPTLVEIGWIDLPKTGGAKAPPALPLATGLPES